MISHQGKTSDLILDNPFKSVHLEPRLEKRLEKIIEAVSESPSKSFPALFPNRSDLEGVYRFMNNEQVEPSDLIAGAITTAITGLVKKREQTFLGVHDTTEFDFSSSVGVEGLGRLTGKRKGFYGHYTILSTLDREIEGLLGLRTWIRTGEPTKQKDKHKKYKQKGFDKLPKEKDRWMESILDAHSRCEEQDLYNVIHVADREADDYPSYATMQEKKIRFVFRVKYDRLINDQSENHEKLFESLVQAEASCEREVVLPPRKQKSRRPIDIKNHPSRKRRTARLGVSCKAVEICCPKKYLGQLPNALKLNFVRVFEINPPPGEQRVEWKLVTSEPIDSESDLLKIVDMYRARWTIDIFQAHCYPR